MNAAHLPWTTHECENYWTRRQQMHSRESGNAILATLVHYGSHVLLETVGRVRELIELLVHK